MLDLGSQLTIIRSDLVTNLGLKRYYTQTPMIGIGGISTNGSQHVVKFSFRPEKSGQPILSVTAAVLKKPTTYLARKLCISQGDIQISDSDSDGYYSSGIDVIFGCDILGQILTGYKVNLGVGGGGGPHALGTIFDFAVFGPVTSCRDSAASSDIGKIAATTLVEAVERFWRTEEPPMSKIRDPADVDCENLYVSTTYRDKDGKYVVRLPLIPGHSRLGDSRQTALRRFSALEKRMARQSEYREKYIQFMAEYLALGHMAVSNFNIHSEEEHYFLAHHGVFKKSGDTAKIRVVFDGSVQTNSGASLNDCLYSGERLQNDITQIILNFRRYRVVFTTDVKMMFRQTWINPADRKYQLLYWRSAPTEPLLVYELTTNTYGLKSSPFIAIRSLHQLADDGQAKYPRAARLLRSNSYVDDLNGGADSIQEALTLKTELTELMHTAGYELRKWSSNVPELLEGLPLDHLETLHTFDDTDETGLIKVLGIQWNPRDDSFTYRVNLPNDKTVTRRSILSMVSRLYDPLGWIAPVVFKIKLLLQSLLASNDNSSKVEWDAPASDDIVRKWRDIIADLNNLRSLTIPRCIKPDGVARFSLHGYGDGSSQGYAASVYLRSVDTEGRVCVKLLMAKSRVAPLRTKQTIPKLELNGAALLTKLINHVVSSMADIIEFDEVVGWCDSTIVLAWLRTPAHKLQVFEGNRVSQINASQVKINWRHVPSDMNCADVASRGTSVTELLQHQLWWGPRWLHCSREQWPTDCTDFPSDMLPGLKSKVVNVGVVESEFNLLDRYSSYETLLNVTGYLLRFGKNCKTQSADRSLGKNLSTLERRNALLCLTRMVQSEHFAEEINALKTGKIIRTSCKRLNLFIDRDDIIRVGGRISASELPYSSRHQILLPGKSKFTDLLVTHYHKVYCHVGANSLAAILSRGYWIVSARRVCRHITFKCIQCFRSRARPTQPFMADLPEDRVRGVRAFLGTGTDFCGPFYIKSSSLRNVKILKCYLCIFVCLATKAVHLEIVADLSLEAFVACFTRFTSRRGLPSLVRSDCGSNYSAADRYLKELYIFLRDNHSELERSLTKNNIKWLFNAPSSPNHGGLFETAVKSAKTHARRVLGETRLTFEELATFFAKVEAVMNSRPLCPLSTDPTDYEVLTPGHFLIGQPLVSLPEYPYEEVKMTRLSRYEQIQKMSQHFWSRWRTEYLHTLQQRYKWTDHTDPPKLDDLVLIKEDNYPALQWRRGRLVKLLPGKDGVVRVAEVRTQNGTLLRPISKLCRLPLEV